MAQSSPSSASSGMSAIGPWFLVGQIGARASTIHFYAVPHV
jgi:hypothetical protein